MNGLVSDSVIIRINKLLWVVGNFKFFLILILTKKRVGNK